MAKEPRKNDAALELHSMRIRRASLRSAREIAKAYSQGNLSHVLRVALSLGLAEVQADPRLLLGPE